MSSKKYLQVQQVIQGLDDESKRYCNEYFRNAPTWLFEEIAVQKFPKGQVFIKEGDAVARVFLLVMGSVKATDYRMQGAMYDYMWFKPVKAFGGLEVILGINEYKTTLTTDAPCTMFVLSRAVYEKWILEDVHALRLEASTTATSLLKQTRRERMYLFMQGMDRMAYFMLHYYDEFAKNGVCYVKLTRQDMCDCTGLSIKTVNRALIHLIESDCIGKTGGKIIINEKHYNELKKYISELIE